MGLSCLRNRPNYSVECPSPWFPSKRQRDVACTLQLPALWLMIRGGLNPSQLSKAQIPSGSFHELLLWACTMKNHTFWSWARVSEQCSYSNSQEKCRWQRGAKGCRASPWKSTQMADLSLWMLKIVTTQNHILRPSECLTERNQARVYWPSVENSRECRFENGKKNLTLT